PRTKNQAGVFVFRQRAAIFGYNAPNYDLLLASLKLTPPASGLPVIFEAPLPEFGFAGGSGFTGTTGLVGFGGFGQQAFPPPTWENRTLEDDNPRHDLTTRYIYLDTTYPAIAKNSWIALVAPAGDPLVLRVTDNRIVTRSQFTISGKLSVLTVELPTN